MTTQNSSLLNIFLISDLHLNSHEPRVTERFLTLLNTITLQADTLYILGDLFESYVGDDDQNPFIESIIAALAARTNAGLRIFLMHGNRDFLIGNTFAKRTGVTLIPDPSVITWHEKKILLMHGDSLCTKDIAHQRFRYWVQKKWVQTVLLSLPLSLRKTIAEKMRRKSTASNHYKTSEIMDVCEEAVINVLRQHQVDILIHGHTHRPATHLINQYSKRIVLGAWHEKGNYLQGMGDGEIKYREFSLV